MAASATSRAPLCAWLTDLDQDDGQQVGGKNASLGEMLQNLQTLGVRVPTGFATTAAAYRRFLEANDLGERLRRIMDGVHSAEDIAKAGRAARKAIAAADMPDEVSAAIERFYRDLCQEHGGIVAVAVRSSATAEDLPGASFAGQQETFLNISGSDRLLQACQDCYASLFTDRAIAYRQEQGFDHLQVALSIGIQRMVRSDRSCSGVMFSIDTETGFPDLVVIDGAWGLGETVVQGSVDPDEFRVFKPLLDAEGLAPIIGKERGGKEHKLVYAAQGGTKTVRTSKRERSAFVLSDEEVLQLARWARSIEEHYGRPMDIEWAKDGDSGELFIVQARPETVQSQKERGRVHVYQLLESGEELVQGLAIGQAIGSGTVKRLENPDQGGDFPDGGVLVTGMTDPDWMPILKRAAAIVTDHGGRTSHAAIVSRELGLPALVGCGDATDRLEDGQEVTVSCIGGEQGSVFDGSLKYERETVDLDELPDPPVRLQMNIASPQAALRWWQLPASGIGLARMEFIINRKIRIHPLALTRYDEIQDASVRKRIDAICSGYADRRSFFIEELSRGIAGIACAQHPHPVVVRLSDFKTNEYAQLIGGSGFEPEEANPMLGFRGAARYWSEDYRDGFDLECQALVRAREHIGLDNIVVMIPFVRTPAEADAVLDAMADNGLVRGAGGLQVYMMGEIPSNVFRIDEFAQRFDGISIGSNDLTQLVLGVDRDSDRLGPLFDERDPAVTTAIRQIIDGAHRHRCSVSICGQAPSDHPDFAVFLLEAGIDSISLNPDSVVTVLHHLDRHRQQEGSASAQQ
ncbi:MAG: phosphoenolpyruvate synthase [Planctomycetota bacterium]